MTSEAKPLIDFREIIEELNHFYRDNNPYFTVQEEVIIEDQINGLINEFKTLFKSLTTEDASSFRYDIEGDTVMENDGAENHSEKKSDKEPYETYDASHNPDMVELLTNLTGAYPFLRKLTQYRTILTSNEPNGDNPTRLKENAENRMSLLLYARNRNWVRELTRDANDFYPLLSSKNDQQRELWAAYGRKIAETERPIEKSSTDETSETNNSSSSVEMNYFDSLFQPLSIIDYSPQEFVVAIAMEKLVSFYRGLVREQLRMIKKQLGQSERDRNAEQMRYETLLREAREGERNLRELKDNLVEKNRLRQKELTDAVIDLHRQEIFSNQRAEQERNKLGGSNAYRNFLTIEYLRREETFLRYLIELLEKRRNNRHLHRLTNANEFFSVKGFAANSLIKNYLKKRDQVLRDIYAADHDDDKGTFNDRDREDERLRVTKRTAENSDNVHLRPQKSIVKDRYRNRV